MAPAVCFLIVSNACSETMFRSSKGGVRTLAKLGGIFTSMRVGGDFALKQSCWVNDARCRVLMQYIHVEMCIVALRSLRIVLWSDFQCPWYTCEIMVRLYLRVESTAATCHPVDVVN